MAVIDKIVAKVTRAKQHIQDFQLGLSEFFETKPYEVRIKEAPDIGKRIYYVAKISPVPDPLAAIASDVIQNLRSPLDHIARQLMLNGICPPTPKDRVYFPISSSATDYKATRRGQIKGVRQQVIDAIDATEPYKGGKGHALWQLQKLNNPDKHHLLVGASSYFGGVEHVTDFMANFKMPPLFLRPAGKLLPLNVGDNLYIEPLDHKMHKDRRFTFEVSFYEPGVIEGEPAIKTLHDMADLVGDIVVKLGTFLP